MSYELKKLENSEIEIIFELTEEEFKPFYESALKTINEKAEVKGFRKGHIPKDILINKFGERMIIEDAKEQAIQKNYLDAIIKENINVVSRPKLEIESENPFKFKLTVAVFPEGTLKDHKSIKVKVEEAKVEEKEIDDLIKTFQERQTKWAPSDEPAKKGDKLELNFEAFDKEGKEVPNTASKNHPIILGEGMIVKSFEDQLFGLKAGEKKDIEVLFPSDYHKKDFQNKSFNFKTEIVRVENPILPEINDEFIKDTTGKSQTLDEFKAEIKTYLIEKKTTENRQKAEDEYVTKLMEIFDVKIPEAMIEEESQYLMKDLESRLSKSKISKEDYFKQTKTDEKELEEKFKKESEKRLTAKLAIRKAIEIEGIKIEDKDLTEELSRIKAMYPEQEHEKIQKDYDSGDLKSMIENRLALEKFFDKVLEK
jgi:trigger factor